MSTKKLRLGVVMAALTAAVGGPALSAVAPVAGWADTGRSTSQVAVAEDSAPTSVTASNATTAIFGWE